MSFIACVNDESKLSFSARSSGRYLLSSILLFFCAGLDSKADSDLFLAFVRLMLVWLGSLAALVSTLPLKTNKKKRG